MRGVIGSAGVQEPTLWELPLEDYFTSSQANALSGLILSTLFRSLKFYNEESLWRMHSYPNQDPREDYVWNTVYKEVLSKQEVNRADLLPA